MNLIRDSLHILQLVRDTGVDEILVAFSGGKDSLATIDLAARVFPRVQPYFRYEVKGLAENERVFAAIERRFHCEMIQVPSPELASKVRFGAMLPREHDFSRNLRHVDIEAYVRQMTGLEWIASGQRMQESLARRGMINSAKRYPDSGTGIPETLGIDRRSKRLYPIASWGPQHVRDYMRVRHLPRPVQTGMNRDRTTGLTLNASNLKHLRENNPEEYRKMIGRFPLAEVIVMRAEIVSNEDQGMADRAPEAE